MEGRGMSSPSTLLCMDTACPPDINLPLAGDAWATGGKDDGDGDCGSLVLAPSKGRRWVRRGDTIWGAWFFFTHYFRPAVSEKSRSRGIGMDGALIDKLDLRLDLFLVQHDMENMYMWAFKQRPENALGKMQLRSYMNGHTRFGEPQFPFSADKGFIRSHRMQRKQYRGLSNPQCVHGIEVVRSPSFANVTEDDMNRWMELTGRDLNFVIPPDAEAFSVWRNVASPEFDLERSGASCPSKTLNGSVKKHSSRQNGKIHGSTLTLSGKLPSQLDVGSDFILSAPGNKRKRKELLPDENEVESCVPVVSYGGAPSLDNQSGGPPCWLSCFSGVMTEVCGPVTGAKTIYEDEKGYLIMVSLPCTNMQQLRVSWVNTATHGIVKVHCRSTGCMPFITRGDRTFKLSDPNPEHCPPGDFVREIGLSTRIPENAELKAVYAEACAGLEIMVPKHHVVSEEREVRVFLSQQLGDNESHALSSINESSALS